MQRGFLAARLDGNPSKTRFGNGYPYYEEVLFAMSPQDGSAVRRRRKRRVKEPLTEELLEELLASPSPTKFVKKHHLANQTLSELLNAFLEEKGLARADVIRAAALNETFGYQIFMGQRNPSRNKVLQIAFAMRLNLRETNRILRAAGASDLYCKNRRDAIIIFCLDKGYRLQKTNEELYRFDEETIC